VPPESKDGAAGFTREGGIWVLRTESRCAPPQPIRCWRKFGTNVTAWTWASGS